MALVPFIHRTVGFPLGTVFWTHQPVSFLLSSGYGGSSLSTISSPCYHDLYPSFFITIHHRSVCVVSSLFINPFSEDARVLVRNYGAPGWIADTSEEPQEIVKHTDGQNIDDNTLIPGR